MHCAFCGVEASFMVKGYSVCHECYLDVGVTMMRGESIDDRFRQRVLGVQGKCGFTFAHTQDYCGHEECRES